MARYAAALLYRARGRDAGLKDARVQARRVTQLRRLGLCCGIVASLLYFAVTASMEALYEGFHPAAQTFSELSAFGVATRSLWAWLAGGYTPLMLAFAWAVWHSAGGRRRLRTAAVMLFAYAALGLLWPLAPIHVRGTLPTPGDAAYILLGAATVLLMLLAIGFAAPAFGKRFGVYSFATFVVVAFCSILVGSDATRVATNLSAQWIGLWQRLVVGAFLLWVAVLAIVLLRKAYLRSERQRAAAPSAMAAP